MNMRWLFNEGPACVKSLFKIKKVTSNCLEQTVLFLHVDINKNPKTGNHFYYSIKTNTRTGVVPDTSIKFALKVQKYFS